MTYVPKIGQVKMNSMPSYLNLARTNLYQIFIEDQWGKASDGSTPFTTFIENGYARYGIADFSSDLRTQLSLLCSEATLPTSSYATAEVKDNFMGVSEEFAHTRINTDIDFTFYIDRNYKILSFFEAWMDFVSGGSDVGQVQENGSPTPGYYRRFNYPNYYKNSGFFIKKFEKDWRSSYAPNISYQLINAFPKSVSSISVAYGEAEVLKVTVTMNYDRYIMRREYAPLSQDGSGSITQQTLDDIKKYSGIIEPDGPYGRSYYFNTSTGNYEPL